MRQVSGQARRGTQRFLNRIWYFLFRDASAGNVEQCRFRPNPGTRQQGQCHLAAFRKRASKLD